MKPGTIALVLAAFACLAVYVLGVGLGATDAQVPGTSDFSKEDKQEWKRRLFHPRQLTEDELGGECTLEDGEARVRAGLSCEVDLAPARERLRVLKLNPLAGARIEATLAPSPPDGESEDDHGPLAFPIKLRDLSAAKELDVRSEGGGLSLTCKRPSSGTQPPACRVQLVR